MRGMNDIDEGSDCAMITHSSRYWQARQEGGAGRTNAQGPSDFYRPGSLRIPDQPEWVIAIAIYVGSIIMIMRNSKLQKKRKRIFF